MRKLIERFADDEFGSTMVDWTVFVTGAVLLSVAVIATLADSWF